MSSSTSTLMYPSLLFLFLLSITLLSPTQAEHHHRAHNPTPNCQHLQADHGSTLQVLQAFCPCSPLRPKTTSSWEETVIQTLLDDQTRLMYLSSLVVGRSVAPVGWGRVLIQSPTYLVRVKVGTPPQTFLMAMDTSNHVGWLPCNGCIGRCGSSSSLFAFDKSSSFKGVACATSQCSKVTNPTCAQKLCTFNQTYGSSTLAAALSQDTLTLASDPIPSYLFGCIQKATGSSVPPQGLLGLGQGPLSLMSQSQHLYKSTFSYCLPSFKSTNLTGSLRLGPVAQPKRIQFTPLLKNPRRPTLYYVNLVGIKVGRKTVDIPPSALAFDPTSGAGTVIDSDAPFPLTLTLIFAPHFRLPPLNQMDDSNFVPDSWSFDDDYLNPSNDSNPSDDSFVPESIFGDVVGKNIDEKKRDDDGNMERNDDVSDRIQGRILTRYDDICDYLKQYVAPDTYDGYEGVNLQDLEDDAKFSPIDPWAYKNWFDGVDLFIPPRNP